MITDGEMPRMDGGGLIHALHEEADGSIPIILWSVNPGRYDRADRTFAKPYGASKILTAADELLGGVA